MQRNRFSLYGITIASILLMTIAGINQVYAAPTTLDVFQDDGEVASAPGEFGGPKIGTVTYEANDNWVNVTADIIVIPSEGNTFEGWLVDTGSGYKLSLGNLVDGQLQFDQTMVYPYTYSQFIITEEPIDDIDPNAAGTFGGAVLQEPFGQ
ncbi:MAG: hypothetical protein L0H53_09770 [Candidatus Nitrosocosmicus sp.]|nr:hypothetical protein [Candidatus Nitrosocosmicus sp.]MDN5867896.1 hypothetical protein [Candidatus Nitrosocosmicus sp.]